MKRKIKTAVLIIVCVVIAAQLIFIIKNRLSFNNKIQREIFAMDTVMQLTVYGKNAEQAVNAAVSEIYKIDNISDAEDKNSDIFRINAGGGQKIEISDCTAEQIRAALDISEKTGGAFDISVYPLVKAWGFISKDYKIPTTDDIEKLKTYVNYKNIAVDGNSVKIEDGMQLSLGGIAKGYTAQRVSDILKNHGIKSAVISLGGNVQTVGKRPDGKKWTVGIQNPNGSADEVCALEVEDKAVVTSGAYQRFFESDGKKYGHIIDGKTGCPADSDLLSVTVICDDGAYADGLSTALFVLGYEKSAEFWNKQHDFDAVFVKKDGTVVVTGGIKDSIIAENTREFSFETAVLK